MKSTGIIRKVDELGRVVLPSELRKTLDIKDKDPVEVFIDNDKIILQKYEPNNACLITGEVKDDNVRLAGGKLILSKEGAEQLINEIRRKFTLFA